MLADGVVVKPEVLGQFGHVDRSAGVGDVPKQLVAARVTERPSLPLEHRRHDRPTAQIPVVAAFTSSG